MEIFYEGLSSEQLKEQSKLIFNRFKKAFGFTEPVEHGSVRPEIMFSDGYSLKVKHFVSGIKSTQRINVAALNEGKEIWNFTATEEDGVPSIDFKGVGLVVKGKSLGCSDHSTLSFFARDQACAVQLGDHLVGKIEGSLVSGELEGLDTELRPLLLPKK